MKCNVEDDYENCSKSKTREKVRIDYVSSLLQYSIRIPFLFYSYDHIAFLSSKWMYLNGIVHSLDVSKFAQQSSAFWNRNFWLARTCLLIRLLNTTSSESKNFWTLLHWRRSFWKLWSKFTQHFNSYICHKLFHFSPSHIQLNEYV